MVNDFDIIIIGGGAAGFFTAINTAENNSKLKIAILEKSKAGLQKVKVSGGGRCNVTHAEFIPSDLVENYPRGEKELLGPFHKFMTSDTFQWFEDRGISLKIEADGRVFPTSNSSETIVNCFLNEAKKKDIKIHYSCAVTGITENDKGWKLETKNGNFFCTDLVIATGSSPKIWGLLKELGHSIIKPVPSLFTFNIKDKRIKGLAGLSVENVTVKLILNDNISVANLGKNIESNGPLLITHWGLSAPSILKLSAFAARELAKCNYIFDISINFIGFQTEDCRNHLDELKLTYAKKLVINSAQFNLPKRLWKNLVLASEISENQSWAEINREQINLLVSQLTEAVFNVNGKSTFKEEFVTAGGIELKEVDFKSFQSKLYKNLYFAGEVLNIDAVTGGFNFQNAWTSAYLVSRSISDKE